MFSLRFTVYGCLPFTVYRLLFTVERLWHYSSLEFSV